MESNKKRGSKTSTKSPKKPKKANDSINSDKLNQKVLLKDGFHCDLYGYESELKYLKKIINNTIESGESNSVLICGDPGCGKTTLLETCLSQIKTDSNISIVRLNGFIHGNDLSTIRFIARQLEMNANDIVHIMQELKNLCLKPKYRALIILDHFDIFCRRNQTLLYNLFDLSQHSSSVCIIGMTTRLDAIELLEKRVKSRLNQRIIQLVTPFIDFEDYIKFALKLLNSTEIEDSLRESLIKDSLRESLKIQYSLNFSVKELKRLLVEHIVSQKLGIAPTVRDTKLMKLSELSKYEISVLLIANKYTKNQNRSTFHCSAIMDSLRHLPQIKLNKNMLFKIMYKLIENDLIIRHSSIKKNDLLMSEWTLFSLNIDDSHLNDVLTKDSNTLPNYIKQI
jgi:origin recognition complex subunit 4